ncbi:MAG: hypothetical protein ACKORB_06750 [Opitutia bacterium]
MFRTILILSVSVLPAFGEQPAHPPSPEPTVEEIQMLRRILELPPERLSRIRGAIEKMERMPPEVRREFAERLAKFENASPDERRAISRDMKEKGGFGGKVLEHHLRSIAPDKAKAERERIMAMTPEARMEFIRTLAARYPEFAQDRRPEPKDMKDGKGGVKRRPTPPTPPTAPAAPQQ